MAATGFTPISLYYTTTASAAPTAGNLVAGELALNNNDGKLFYKDSSGVVQTIATKASAALGGSTTGSGATVLATSPTLTTPNLGTPSAINLTNATALAFAALPTGSVLQIVNISNTTDSTTASSTYADTSITATITPKYSTSKILAIVNVNGILKTSTDTYGQFRLTRGGSSIRVFGGFLGQTGSILTNGCGGCSCTVLDNPATTSATTYTVQFASASNTGTIYVNLDADSTITLMEIAG